VDRKGEDEMRVLKERVSAQDVARGQELASELCCLVADLFPFQRNGCSEKAARTVELWRQINDLGLWVKVRLRYDEDPQEQETVCEITLSVPATERGDEPTNFTNFLITNLPRQ